MTSNQIEYAKYLESKRHNQITEQVSTRDVSTKERQARVAELSQAEDVRHNVRTEQLTAFANIETRRSNIAREAENVRHNVAYETETKRHNVAGETETKRHNIAYETETQRHNVEQEAQNRAAIGETVRHNLATEGQTDRSISESIRHNKAMEANDYIKARAASTQASAAITQSHAAMSQAAAATKNAATNAANALVNARLSQHQIDLIDAQTAANQSTAVTQPFNAVTNFVGTLFGGATGMTRAATNLVK